MSRRSSSVSEMRRPIIARSTGIGMPAGAGAAIGGRSVPSGASPKCANRAPARLRSPRRLRTDNLRASASTLPKPPTALSITPKRQLFTVIQPRSSAGSPRCASSQSSTARTPSGPMIRLPLRKSPCTSRGALASRASVIAQPAEGGLEHRASAAEGSVAPVKFVELLGCKPRPQRRETFGGTAWMRARIAPHWKARRRAQFGELGIPQNAARKSFAFDLADTKPRPRSSRGSRDVTDARRRHAAFAGTAYQQGLTLGADASLAGRGVGGEPAHDQRRNACVADGIERPGFLAGASGQALAANPL